MCSRLTLNIELTIYVFCMNAHKFQKFNLFNFLVTTQHTQIHSNNDNRNKYSVSFFLFFLHSKPFS